MTEYYEGLMNNKYLVAMMCVELEYMRHVIEKEESNTLGEFIEMPRHLAKLPTFTQRGINKWINNSMDSYYPISMLDKGQKIKLQGYINDLGYEKVHEVARQTVMQWININRE